LKSDYDQGDEAGGAEDGEAARYPWFHHSRGAAEKVYVVGVVGFEVERGVADASEAQN
jgi:hypothetical protein